ncbi:MAG TPA: hypothetical protein VMT93_04990 [Gemmatimonadaceae bacterium]|nr:hypothetical protein [Gemmatimonadaceae bacterium]
MSRRLFTLLALALTSYVITACTVPTAPKADCAVVSGSGTCAAR